jgi:hypothetical protein
MTPLFRRTKIESERERTAKESLAILRELMDTGDEEAYVAYLKKLFPNITPEQLKSDILAFRAYRLERLRASGKIL